MPFKNPPRSASMRMRTMIVTIAASKGGSGKSTATAVLAVKAAEEGLRVAMFDLNSDQMSLSQWWDSRGGPDNPVLFDTPDHLASAVDAITQQGFEWLFIDTPPQDIDLVEIAVKKSDAVVIPVRVSAFDIGAITPIVEMCRKHHKPFAFLLSAFDGRAQFKKLNEEAQKTLAAGGPILATWLQYHVAHINALTIGKVGHEINPSLQPEAEALWGEVKRLASSTAPLRRHLPSSGGASPMSDEQETEVPANPNDGSAGAVTSRRSTNRVGLGARHDRSSSTLPLMGGACARPATRSSTSGPSYPSRRPSRSTPQLAVWC